MDTGFVGQVSIYYGDTKAKGINDQTQPGGTHALSSSTEYWFEFERDELTFTARAFQSDGTTLLFSETTTDSPPGALIPKVHHNTGQFAINQFGGTTTIHLVEVSSDSLRNSDAVFIGDSILYGGDASSLANRWVSEYVTAEGVTSVVLAGWADRMVDGETRLNEVKALNPKNVFICLGSNDIAAGTWGTTGETSLDDSIIFLQANTSATIYLVSPTARNDFNVTQVETDMLTKGLTVLELFSLTKQPANSNLQAIYNGGDGVHLNDLGHDTCATEASTEIPL